MKHQPGLLDDYQIRSLKLKNRIVVSPMAMYSAENGYMTPFHRTHYAKFAMGGAGLVIIEQTAVTRNGRISNGDLGLWEDNQIGDLAQLVTEMKGYGAAVGIQLNHGGRKSSQQRAFRGNGPLTETDLAMGEEIWQPLAPSAQALAEDWLQPKALGKAGLQGIQQAFVNSASRAVSAGVDLIELHMAHGYLLQNFLSPLANKRKDQYGGSLENRMRFPTQVVQAIRAAIPETMPLFVRISATDWMEGGWTLEDSIVLARKLKAVGVDLIDCSSGGNMRAGATNSNLIRGPGYQVPLAEEIKKQSNIATAAVGMIRTPEFADQIIQEGKADLVCIGRQMLYNPFWGHHAVQILSKKSENQYKDWPEQYGWWLEKWDTSLKRNNESPLGPEVFNSK